MRDQVSSRLSRVASVTGAVLTGKYMDKRPRPWPRAVLLYASLVLALAALGVVAFMFVTGNFENAFVAILIAAGGAVCLVLQDGLGKHSNSGRVT